MESPTGNSSLCDSLWPIGSDEPHARQLTKLERQVRRSGLCARQNIRRSSAAKSEDERAAFEETLKHSKIHTPRCCEYHVSCCARKEKARVPRICREDPIKSLSAVCCRSACARPQVSDFGACVGKVQDAAFTTTTTGKIKVWRMACAGSVCWFVVLLAGSFVGLIQ